MTFRLLSIECSNHLGSQHVRDISIFLCWKCSRFFCWAILKCTANWCGTSLPLCGKHYFPSPALLSSLTTLSPSFPFSHTLPKPVLNFVSLRWTWVRPHDFIILILNYLSRHNGLKFCPPMLQKMIGPGSFPWLTSTLLCKHTILVDVYLLFSWRISWWVLHLSCNGIGVLLSHHARSVTIVYVPCGRNDIPVPVPSFVLPSSPFLFSLSHFSLSPFLSFI